MADGYQVITQKQTVGKLPDDTFGPVVAITFRTASGVVLSVTVPVDRYNADNVRAAIEATVAEADAITNL